MNNLDNQNDKNNMINHYEASFSTVVLMSFTSIYFISLFFILLLFVNDIRFFVALLLCLIGAGIIMTYIRYGQFTVSSNRDNISIAKGVLIKSNYTIQRHEINGLIIKRTFPSRLLNFIRVELVCSGDNIDKTLPANVVLFPFISEVRAKKILSEILPTVHIQDKLQPLPNQAIFINLVQPSFSLVFFTFISLFFWPEYWAIPLILFLSFVLYRVCKTNWTKYSQDAQWMQVQTGVFTTKTFITVRENITAVKLKQTWLQQKLDLTTMIISTRSEPIHLSIVEHIPVQTGEQMVQWHEAGDLQGEK